MSRPIVSCSLVLLLVTLGLVPVLPAAAEPPAPKTSAARPAAIKAVLARRILAREVAQFEAQEYSRTNVAKMPKLTTAEAWKTDSDRLRRRVLDEIIFRGEAAKWRDAPSKVEWFGEIPAGPGYRIKRLRFEALPGLWVPALLYEPEKLTGKVPAIVNVNGHTPLGTSYPPKQIRCINLAKKGVVALNLEWIGMGQLGGPGFNHDAMNQLDLCGTSGVGVFYLAMARGVDVLLKHDNVDPERIGVTGLSGGGWQSIILGSLDTRVNLVVPVAGYSSFFTRAEHLKDLGDSEQTPNDMAALADYTTLTAMVAPRSLLLIYNSRDNCCFESGYSLPALLDAAMPVFGLLGKYDAIRWHVNDEPGTHNYELENREALYKMVRDAFLSGDPKFDAKEIPSDNEVKPQDQLSVPMPAKNEDFNTLALRLAKDLPRNPELPTDKDAAVAWQKTAREKLASITRAERYEVQPVTIGSQTAEGVRATLWNLRMGDRWSVPAVELVAEKLSGPAKRTLLVVADRGRASVAERAAAWLAAGDRVVVVDPFCFGEAHCDGFFARFPLHVAGVGGRPLGIQAGQLAAAARWIQSREPGVPVRLVGMGRRAGVAALIAAALDQEAVAQVELHESLGSLAELIEQNRNVTDTPGLFCFGLLEAFDLRQIAAMVAPRPVELVNPSPRAQKEMAPVQAFREMLGGVN